MIRMQLNTDDFTFLVGNFEVLMRMQETPALPMFSETAVGFLSALSRICGCNFLCVLDS